jgi:hypothetical protein
MQGRGTPLQGLVQNLNRFSSRSIARYLRPDRLVTGSPGFRVRGTLRMVHQPDCHIEYVPRPYNDNDSPSLYASIALLGQRRDSGAS